MSFPFFYVRGNYLLAFQYYNNEYHQTTGGSMKGAYLLILIVGVVLTAGCGSRKQSDSYADKMMQEHDTDRPVANAESEIPPSKPVKTKNVNYATVDGQEVKGYLAVPEMEKGSTPGIIVIHEWWGLNDNIRAMARRFAGEGYASLAVDLYDGKVASNPDSAYALMKASMDHSNANIENLKQAYSYLADSVKATKIGVIGWCFGGGWSLRTALAMPDKIDATVIYYGQLVTNPDQLKTLQMPIAAFFGGQDKSISEETIHKFESTLDSLGKSVQVKIYPDANHAFANPSGTRYNPEAAEDAWQRTMRFLNQNLK